MTAVDSESAESGDELDLTYPRRLLLVVMLAVMAFGSLMTIVTVSLDEIATDLDSSRATLTWMITGLMLAMAVMTPIGGKLGDIKGHRTVFLIGLVGGVVTTLASGLAWDATSMIVFRVLFGVTGALVMPNGMALMMHAYGPTRRATAMGWFQFAMTGAPTIGLVIGGPLIDIVGWRWIFVAFAAVSVIAAVVGSRLIRPTPRMENVAIDYLGALALAAAVLAGLLTLTRVSELVRDAPLSTVVTDPLILALAVVCIVGIAAFIRVENRTPDPMLELRYFKRRNFTLPMVSAALMQFAYMGGFVVTPALLGGLYGLSVGAIAITLAPRPGAFSLASPIGGYLATTLGERKPVVLGAMAMVASMATFAVAASMTGALGITFIVFGLMLSGISAGISQPAIASMVAGAVDPQDMGIANGMNQQIMFIGVVSGIQTMNVFLGDGASAGRFTATFVFGAVMAGFGLVASLATRAEPPSR
ncbi:MAG: MFS transporter [Actinomycetia bacterium]|nr:MFS transporter [Actinomycetes bacterium]MCP4225923.1 MFS transporter [Actinomycetes bacterium]MCP5033770.1 MFS transporter [Actinomycetes bacterium]